METKNILGGLGVGRRAQVKSIDCEPAMKRRLYDMGLTPGADVKCVGMSPLGDPKAYLIRGAVVALRLEDALKITIRR